jgi:hypothetical protein
MRQRRRIRFMGTTPLRCRRPGHRTRGEAARGSQATGRIQHRATPSTRALALPPSFTPR